LIHWRNVREYLGIAMAYIEVRPIICSDALLIIVVSAWPIVEVKHNIEHTTLQQVSDRDGFFH
jgi:hypothetical protein